MNDDNMNLKLAIKQAIEYESYSPDFDFLAAGDLMEIESFRESCKENWLIDYDGVGVFTTKDGTDEEWGCEIYPSEMVNESVEIPKWATHVRWFNR